jgi:hypothetical protein
MSGEYYTFGRPVVFMRAERAREGKDRVDEEEGEEGRDAESGVEIELENGKRGAA